jgi:hypothetical protein
MLVRFFRPLTRACDFAYVDCPQACAWGYLLLPADAGFDFACVDCPQARAWGYLLMPADAGFASRK